jgi:hypothetical protein
MYRPDAVIDDYQNANHAAKTKAERVHTEDTVVQSQKKDEHPGYITSIDHV